MVHLLAVIAGAPAVVRSHPRILSGHGLRADGRSRDDRLRQAAHGLLETRYGTGERGEAVVGRHGDFVDLAENDLFAQFAGLAHALDLFFDTGDVHLIGGGLIGQRLDECEHFRAQAVVVDETLGINFLGNLVAVVLRLEARNFRVLFGQNTKSGTSGKHGGIPATEPAKKTTQTTAVQKAKRGTRNTKTEPGTSHSLASKFSQKKDLQNFPDGMPGFLEVSMNVMV